MSAKAIRGPKAEERLVEEPVATPRALALPAPGAYQAYKAEVRTLIVILAVLLVAAGLSLNVDRESEPVFFGTPDLTAQATPDLSELLQAQAPLAPVAAAPQEAPAITVITVPVPSPANDRPVIIREPRERTAATPRPTVPKFDNGGTPPVVRITRLGPANQAAGSPVELTFQAGDSDGVISGWIIDWGDGSTSADSYDDRCGPPPGEPDHEFPAQKHTYRDIGEYGVKVLVVSKGTCNSGPTQRATDQASIQIGPAVVNMVIT